MKKIYVLIATPIREVSLAGVEAESFKEASALLGARLVKRLTKRGDGKRPSYEIDFSLEEVEKDKRWTEIPSRSKKPMDRRFQRKGIKSLEIYFYRFNYTNEKPQLALDEVPFRLEELPLIK